MLRVILAAAIVFTIAYSLPQIEALLNWEPGISEADQIELMNMAYQEGFEHGMHLCAPRLPEGPRIRRKGGTL